MQLPDRISIGAVMMLVSQAGECRCFVIVIVLMLHVAIVVINVHMCSAAFSTSAFWRITPLQSTLRCATQSSACGRAAALQRSKSMHGALGV